MEQQVIYKYNRMELEQFALFEENYSPEIAEVQFQTETQFAFDKEHSVLCCKIVVNMRFQEKPLAKAELRSHFDIQPDSLESLRNEGNIIFPPAILVQFASLSYGSMRGVLFAKTMGTPLDKYILPPLYFGNLIDKSFAVEG